MQDDTLVDIGEFEDWEPWDQSLGLPTIHNCDLGNPRQMFLWMFVGLPGVVGAPLVFPIEYWELVSFHQAELGARLGADPIKKYRPSSDSMLNKHTAAGEWVDIDEPDPEPVTMADVVAKMEPQAQSEFRQFALGKLGFSDGDTPEPLGPMSVQELSLRLKINVDRLVMVLADFGLNLTVDSHVDRDVAERLVAHMGL